MYRALAETRLQKSILFGNISTHVDGDVFAYNRVKKGNPGYLVAVNLGDDVAEFSLKKPEEEEEDDDDADEEKEEPKDKLPW